MKKIFTFGLELMRLSFPKGKTFLENVRKQGLQIELADQPRGQLGPCGWGQQGKWL